MNRAAALLGLLLAGCPTATFTPASQRTYPPKPVNCFIELFGSTPSRPYDEIGVYDLGGADIEQADELRAFLQPRACQIGADAILYAANGQGAYVKALALRWRNAEPTPAAPPP